MSHPRHDFEGVRPRDPTNSCMTCPTSPVMGRVVLVKVSDCRTGSSSHEERSTGPRNVLPPPQKKIATPRYRGAT